MILFSLFCIAGCTCNNEELSKNLINSANKEYLKTNSETVLFKNQNNTDIIVQFESSSFVTSKDDVGPESCEYNTYEYGKRMFNMGDYSGQISIDYNSNLSIQINDNGLAIPEEELDTIFMPFVTHKTGGTGVGLALAKKIVEAHKGSIQLSSTKELTSFTLLLPLPQYT